MRTPGTNAPITGITGRDVFNAQSELMTRADALAGQPARAGRTDRRHRVGEHELADRRLRPHRARRTAGITCSAITRRRIRATDGSTRSRCKTKRPGLRVAGAARLCVAARPDRRRTEARRRSAARARSEAAECRQDLGRAARRAHQPAAAERPELHGAGGAVQEHARRRRRSRSRSSSTAIACRTRPPNAKGCVANKIELSFYGLNEHGKALAGTRTELDLTLRPETRERVKTYGVRVNPRINLPPGRYQLRIGARDAVGGHDRLGVLRPRGARLPQRETDDGRAAARVGIGPADAEHSAGSGCREAAARRRHEPARVPAARHSSRSTPRSTTTSNRTQARRIDVAVRLLSESGTEVFAVRDELTNGGVAPKKAVGHLRLRERDRAEGRPARPLRAPGRSASAWKRRRRETGREGNADYGRAVVSLSPVTRLQSCTQGGPDAKLDCPARGAHARSRLRP